MEDCVQKHQVELFFIKVQILHFILEFKSINWFKMHCGCVTVQILMEMIAYEYNKSAKCTTSLILCSSVISNITHIVY